MKKLLILVLACGAFWLIMLSQSAVTEMAELKEKEMRENSIGTGDFYITAVPKTETDTESRKNDELEESDEDKLDNYLHTKSDSEILTPESKPKVDSMEQRDYSFPSGRRIESHGRTMTIRGQEYDVIIHDTGPPEIANPNAP